MKAGDRAWFREGHICEQVEMLKILAPEDIDQRREWTREERRRFHGYRLRTLIGEEVGEEYSVWGVYPGGWSLEPCAA